MGLALVVMEIAISNAVAVRSLNPSCFLLFFTQQSSLKAIFCSPKLRYWLSSALPAAAAACIDQYQPLVQIESRTFTLKGKLMGGGACCAKADAPLPSRAKSTPYNDIMTRLGKAASLEAAQPDLVTLHKMLDLPSLESFRDALEALAGSNWVTHVAKPDVVELLLRVSEQLYLQGRSSAVTPSPPLCQQLQTCAEQAKAKALREGLDEIYLEASFDAIISAILEIAEGGIVPELAPVQAALTGSSVSADISFDAYVFHESLVAALQAIRVVAKYPDQLAKLDTYTQQESSWQLQAFLVRNYCHLPAKDMPRDQWEAEIAAHLDPYLLNNAGQSSYKVRAIALQSLHSLITSSSASETKKEVASLSILKAFGTESHEGVLTILKKLPRTYLNPFMICVALSGSGCGGLFNLKTNTLQAFQSPLLHGTARAVASLYGTVVISGGLINSKKCIEINPTTSIVHELPMLNVERYWHGACLVGFELIVCGGRSTPDGEALASVEKLGGDRWVSLPDMTCRRESLTCSAWGTKVYAVGGIGDPQAPVSIEVLDRNVWRRLDLTLPAALLVPGVYLKSDEEMVIGGGRREDQLAEVFVLNLKTGARQDLPALPHPAAFSGDLVEMKGETLVFLSSEAQELFELSPGAQAWTTRTY